MTGPSAEDRPNGSRVVASDVLAAALEVEEFLASCRIACPDGVLWSRTERSESAADESTPHTLYHGSAGIALFYLELHQSTGTKRFLDEAVSAGDELLAYLDRQGFITVGFYSGWPTYLFVLGELAKASGEPRFRQGATKATERMASQASQLGAGIGWIEPMPFSEITGMTGDRELIDLSVGAAGGGLGFLYAHRQGLSPKALGWAIQTADRLLEVAVKSDAGTNWLMMSDMPFPFTATNFAHGAAGVGYFFADLHRATDEHRYLEAALEAARYVQNHAEPSGDGCLVGHTDENPELNYLGVCHGPPGTGRLMLLLAEITGEDKWLDWVHANMRGLLATGAPEVRSDGLWENYGQCCGDAGIGDYALSLYGMTGEPEYRDLVDRIVVEVLAQSQQGNAGRSWDQAEHRSRPRFTETQTGYMQGAAGLGSFLLHVATFEGEASSKIALPDSPFDR